MNTHYFLDLTERVIATFVETYIAAVVVLPGDVWNSKNWKIAVGGAIAATIKSILASRVGNKNSASMIPVAGAVGASAGAAIGTPVGEAVGGVGDAIGGLLGALNPFKKGDKSD